MTCKYFFHLLSYEAYFNTNLEFIVNWLSWIHVSILFLKSEVVKKKKDIKSLINPTLAVGWLYCFVSGSGLGGQQYIKIQA